MYKLLLFPLLFISQLAYAVEFDIYQSDYKPLNIALMVDALPEQEKQQDLLNHVIQHDLESSQSFHALHAEGFLASPEEAFLHVDYDDWRIIGADVLALCKLTETDVAWHVDLQVHQPFQGKVLLKQSFEVKKDALRSLAHQLSNHIYQAVLNIPGHFSSQLLYVPNMAINRI